MCINTIVFCISLSVGLTLQYSDGSTVYIEVSSDLYTTKAEYHSIRMYLTIINTGFLVSVIELFFFAASQTIHLSCRVDEPSEVTSHGQIQPDPGRSRQIALSQGSCTLRTSCCLQQKVRLSTQTRHCPSSSFCLPVAHSSKWERQCCL